MSTISSKINRILLLLFMSMIHINAIAQSSNWNYVQTKTFLDENASTFLRHIDYYDELGMVSETVDVGGNTTNTPIKIKTEYNRQLKPQCQWTPVPNIGYDYIDIYGAADAAEDFYGYYDSPYSVFLYDDFLQLTASTKPSENWYGHPVTITRNMVPAGVVKKYTVDANGNLCVKDKYPYGLLKSATTTDEDGRSVTVYTNMHGNTILERRGADDEIAETYYVYDDFGRLSHVLPPMCQEDTANMPKYWYRYKYDDRGRCIEKQLPDCEPVKYWYDNANRIQSEQDGQLREQGLYRNYSYDDIGRLVLQAIGDTQEEATEDGSLIVEVKNYYDDYTCLQELAQLFPEWAASLNISQQSPMVARGKPTATLCYTSDGNRYFEMYQYNSKGLVSDKLSIYDGQWMKTINTTYNFVGDTRNTKESIYTLNNGKKSLLAGRRTTNSYYSGTRLLKKVQVTQLDQKGNTSTQIVSSPKYDVFGNMTSNDRPGTAADMMYTYDTLHGWVKEISSPSGFNEILLRENASNAQFSGNIGSIQWKNTKKGELHQYDYTYDSLGRLIDSRYSSSATDNDGHFDEFVGYNANGSIISLLRNGMKNDGTFGLIDNLEINYDGNRLLNVEDRAESLNYNGAQDFNDGDNSEVEYEYDCNGALKRDSNRGIDIISYDYGHHPNNVSMGMRHIRYDYTPDGRKLSTSHATTISKRITNVTTDTYIDGLILRNGKPQMWQFGGGYVELDDNGTPTSWNYYITDHLGSTRMVVDSNNNIKETINYYPFGSEMRMENPALMVRNNKKISMETAGFTMPSDSAVNIKEPGIMMPIDSVAKGNEPALAYEDYWQPYRFSGKELDKQNGLNMYDFGARLFDVAGVPMWTSVDPLAEKYYPFTPYSYCAGDPVNKFDPDGKAVWLFATKLPGVHIPFATHTFLVVTGKNGKVLKYAAYGPQNGNLVGDKLTKIPYEQDVQVYTDYFNGKENENLKGEPQKVNVPKGMESEQFDKKVMQTINSFGNKDGITYNIFGGSDETSGNCNTSSSTILIKSGVGKEEMKSLESNIEGINSGFRTTTPKPWTEEEQTKALEEKEQNNKFKAL